MSVTQSRIASTLTGFEDMPSRSSERVKNLRQRVRAAMAVPPVIWECPARIDDRFMAEPLPVRKARAIALKLAQLPTALWAGQLLAGSLTLEDPRLHSGDPRHNAATDFPGYLTASEEAEVKRRHISLQCAGHIVPDYPVLLAQGLNGIRGRAEAQMQNAANPAEAAFLRSTIVALDGVNVLAERLAAQCETDAGQAGDTDRRAELLQMAENFRQSPAGPAGTFWQALQSVWLLHMVFHSTMNRNALGRADQYLWPFLEADLREGRLEMLRAVELVECFCLKFNERARTLDEQRSENRDMVEPETRPVSSRRRSSQVGADRDRIDAVNHWLQNIIIGGLTPDGGDGTNPVTHLLLRAYERNQMTNPLVTVRLHSGTPDALLTATCEVLKAGGGMPALFNDEILVPALEKMGIPCPDARDYTNDGCWEVIIPGRTDFRFMRLSLLLCLEWVLNRGHSLVVDAPKGEAGTPLSHGVDTGDPATFQSFEELWKAFLRQLDAMAGRAVSDVVASLDTRSEFAPTPLLSALIDGTIEKRRDLTAGGAKFRTYALIGESGAHTIDSLAAIRSVCFEQGLASLAEVRDAMRANFVGHESLRAKLLAGPKYGNDDPETDALGRALVDAFTGTVRRHAAPHEDQVKCPCGMGTFSWYVGIGQGLGASPDGRRSGEPVSSNFSPALGRDVRGIPSAILSYSGMPHIDLAAGGPLDLRLPRHFVPGAQGTEKMKALVRGFVDAGGAMLTLTVADTEELLAAQQEPDHYRSLRVRMGGWCAFFTLLSLEQQDHQIRRQGGRLS